MSSISIQFGTKFCQVDLDEIISKYWEDTIGKTHNEVVFDLSLTEWISTEEIAFLFGWIRNINQIGKKVTVFLPFPYNIRTLNRFTSEELKTFKVKYDFEENEKRIERRKRRHLFLLSVWGMLDRTGLKSSQFNYIIDGYNTEAEKKKAKYTHQVIPFTVIDTFLQGGELKFDTQYEEVLEGIKSKNGSTQKGGLFDLEAEIISKLKTYACYSPFESKIISNIITQELYSNASQHSQAEKNNFENECYFTSALNNKWENPYNTNFIEQFTKEKYNETLDFYKDKYFLLLFLVRFVKRKDI